MSNIAILDHHNANKIYFWHSGDTEENWKKGKERFGSTWRYYNDTIEYRFNSLGYRGPDPVELQGDYFVALGCSHTAGLGVHLEDTYCHLLSTELNLPYLNFGFPGGAQNLVWTNATLLAKNSKQLPKFVILQWPEIERLTIFHEEGISLFLPNFHGGDYAKPADKKLYISMLKSENFLYAQAIVYFQSTNLMLNSLGIKTINFTLSEMASELFDIHCFKGWGMDESLAARDLIHPGPIHHRQMLEFIKGQL
jgi:hypothetical protein